MAIISEFFQDPSSSKRHPTTVQCGWKIIFDDSGKLLQLSTYGSDERISRPKVSQTIQLNRDAARALLQIISQAFPDELISRPSRLPAAGRGTQA